METHKNPSIINPVVRYDIYIWIIQFYGSYPTRISTCPVYGRIFGYRGNGPFPCASSSVHVCVYSNFYDRGNLLTNLSPPPRPGIRASRRFNFGNPPQLTLSLARAPALSGITPSMRVLQRCIGRKGFWRTPSGFFLKRKPYAHTIRANIAFVFVFKYNGGFHCVWNELKKQKYDTGASEGKVGRIGLRKNRRYRWACERVFFVTAAIPFVAPDPHTRLILFFVLLSRDASVSRLPPTISFRQTHRRFYPQKPAFESHPAKPHADYMCTYFIFGVPTDTSNAFDSKKRIRTHVCELFSTV